MKARRALSAPAGLAERVWAKLERRDGHWLWVGAKDPAGYGRVQIDGVAVGAHRVVYELLVAPIPAELEIDHLCRVPACVNPSHLEPVTHAENGLRGNGVGAVNAKKDRCHKGHEFDRVWKGRRLCQTCRAEYIREWRARKRAA